MQHPRFAGLPTPTLVFDPAQAKDDEDYALSKDARSGHANG